MANENIVSARGAGMVSGQGRDVPMTQNNQDYNVFDRSQKHNQTQKFADINPFFAKKFIAGDIPPINSSHELQTYTLSAPQLSDMYMHRSFFQVPLQAIYHNTFNVFFKNPVRGNDISDNFRPKFWMNRIRGNSSGSLYDLLLNYPTYVQTGVSDQNSIDWLNSLFLAIQIFSHDGLLQKLGYGIKTNVGDLLNEWIFYELYSNIGSVIIIEYTDGVNTFRLDKTSSNNYPMLYINNSSGVRLSNLSDFREVLNDLINNKYQITSFFSDMNNDSRRTEDFDRSLAEMPIYQSDEYINLEYLIAYQYVCCQFYTNSFVDDIFTARDWEENIKNLCISAFANSPSATIRARAFSEVLNGVRYEYDLISRGFLTNLLYCFHTSGASYGIRYACIPALRNIFEIHQSLRTSDYFVDARTQPLSVGDINVQVNQNVVNAIDINKALWVQRLVNAVNRIPQHIETYLKSMFGFEPQSKDPKPYFLFKERFLIGDENIENTSDSNQGNIVVRKRSNSGMFYETLITEPSIIIGLVSYSIDYVHKYSMDKNYLEFDRLDNFNPYFQHVGDQPLLFRELNNDPSVVLNQYFGYHPRYYQYKKSIDICSGAFASGDLNNWSAIFEEIFGFNQMIVLDSFFIRNHNSDIDKFYSSLTAHTLSEYYHFICKFNTQIFVKSKQQKYPSLV